MKLTFVVSALVASVVAFSSCAPQKIQPVVVPTKLSGTASNGAGSDKVLNDVNAYRAAHGKSALKRHAGLDKLALQHSRFMMQNRGKFGLHGKNVTHDGFEGRTMVARSQFSMDNFHENVAAVPERGTSLVQTWINSPGHEKALRATWSYTGIGVVRDKDGMLFATQLFGTSALPNSRARSQFGMY